MGDYVTKLTNCRHEIARWRKNNPPYKKEKIIKLQQALEEIQSDDSIIQEEIVEVYRKLHERIKMRRIIGNKIVGIMWHTPGDLNTKFYHSLTKQCQA